MAAYLRSSSKKLDAPLIPQLEVLVRQQPVLMIFEDAHWACLVLKGIWTAELIGLRKRVP